MTSTPRIAKGQGVGELMGGPHSRGETGGTPLRGSNMAQFSRRALRSEFECMRSEMGRTWRCRHCRTLLLLTEPGGRHLRGHLLDNIMRLHLERCMAYWMLKAVAVPGGGQTR